MKRMIEHFLGVALHFAGAVQYDETSRKAVRKQRAVDQMSAPKARPTPLRRVMTCSPLPISPKGHIEFFVAT